MNYTIIAGFILAFALNIFSFNYRLSGINKVYLGLYKGIAEDSVITVDNKGRDLNKPVFCKAIFVVNIESYLTRESKSIPPAGYNLTLYDDNMKVKIDYGTTAVLRLYFYPPLSHQIQRKAVFTIQEGRGA